MKETFKFKFYSSADENVYTATKNDSNYDISWKDDNGGTFYSDYMVEQAIKEKFWLIIKDKVDKTFTVKYYDNTLQEFNEKSFNKKKEALNFIGVLQTLAEIKDIKLFKTKEILLDI